MPRECKAKYAPTHVAAKASRYTKFFAKMFSSVQKRQMKTFCNPFDTGKNFGFTKFINFKKGQYFPKQF